MATCRNWQVIIFVASRLAEHTLHLNFFAGGRYGQGNGGDGRAFQ